jgi:hypothetical protein
MCMHVCVSETGSFYVAQADLELVILLTPFKYWDYKYEPLYLAILTILSVQFSGIKYN